MVFVRLLKSFRLAAVALCLPVAQALALEAVTLSVRGGSDPLEEELRAASLTLAAQRDGLENPQDVLAAAQADYARLVGVLYATGRYSGTVRILVDGREAANIQPLNAPPRIDRIAISVDPGRAFRFGTARIAPLARATELPEGFAPGQVARSGLIEDAVRAGIDGWRDQGHAKAEVAAQRLRADHRAGRLDADVRLQPGPRLRFGELVLQGDSAVRRARIRKIAGLPEGRVFDPAEAQAAATRLRRTGAFRSVSLTEAAEPNPDGTLDMELALVDAKPRRFGFGAEYSTLEGATLSGFWLHRNLLGGAERLRVDGEIGGIGGETGGTDLSLGARYERPATPKPDTSLFVELGLASLDEPDYSETQYRTAVGLHRIESDELEGELAIEWQHSTVKDELGRREFDLLSLPFSATRDRRDDVLNARSGDYLHAELRPFLGFGSTSSGLRFFGEGRIYREVSERLVLAGRLQLGSVSGPSVATAPPDYLFYSGGGGTVRGQSYQSLGIDLPSGQRRGGRSFLGLSAEARMDISDTIGIVGFADAGYVGEEPFYDGSGDWHSGAGLGLRYNTGIGPIRLDVALPVGGGGSGAQLYIGIGQAF